MRTIPSRIPKPRTARVGRPQGGFTQHRRIDRLRELLEAEPRGLTLEELARMLRITQRSVRRYLRELDGTKDTDRFELLESVVTTPGGPNLWRIRPGERGRAVALRRAQAYALLATRRALDTLKGSALYDEVDLALAQIAKIAQTPFRSAGKAEISGQSRLEDRFFWLPPQTKSYAARGEDLDELFRAVADLRVLRFRPRARKPAEGEPRERAERIAFHPYGFVLHEGTVFVVGARAGDAGTDEPEVVALETMSDIRTSETEHFELPTSFDIEQYVHGTFGVARPTKTRFIVEFDARVSEEIRARKLHPQQRMATAPDGRVRVSLPLVDRRAAIAWILSWGDAAHVVEPADLARDVGDTLKRAAARYR